MQCVARLGWRIACDDRLYRHRLHNQPLALHQKRKPLAVGRFETGLNLCQGPKPNHQRRIAAFIAHVHAAVRGDAAATGLLALQFHLCASCKCIESDFNVRHGRLRQLHFNGLLPNCILVGQAHAVGAEHTCQWMHKHPCHAQCIGHQAGVLPARATKALQGVAGHVIAARNRYLLDGIGHLLHCDVDEALRAGLRR